MSFGYTPEPCTGDCERKAVRIVLAAGERASDNTGQMVEAAKPVKEFYPHGAVHQGNPQSSPEAGSAHPSVQ